MKKKVWKHRRPTKGATRIGLTDYQLAEEFYELCKGRQRKWAEEHGFTRQYINAVCNGRMPISEKLADIIEYDRENLWIKRKPK